MGWYLTYHYITCNSFVHLQKYRINAAAFKPDEEICLKSETSMPQHSVTNAATFEAQLRKIKRPNPVYSSSFLIFLSTKTLKDKTHQIPKHPKLQSTKIIPNSFNPTSTNLNSFNPSTTSWFQRVFWWEGSLQSHFSCGFSSNQVSVPIFFFES